VKNIKHFGKAFLLVAIFVLAYFMLPVAMPLLIGGVITQGILGGFAGKVGPVVGGKWKDIDYMRSYVIPANPQSVDQTAQRTRFSTIQGYVRQVLSTLVQPYWDPYYTNMSGYNAITSNWLLNADGSDLLDGDCLFSKGTLAPQAIDTAVLSGSNITVSWTENLTGNQLTSDQPVGFVFNKATGDLYQYTGGPPKTRGSESFSMSVPNGLSAADLRAYVFFSQGTGSSMIISDSENVVCTAP